VGTLCCNAALILQSTLEEGDEKHGSADPTLRGQRYDTPSTWAEPARRFFINHLEFAEGGQKLGKLPFLGWTPSPFSEAKE
jgi:hypothetical protein